MQLRAPMKLLTHLSSTDLTQEIVAASKVFGKYFAYGESSCDGWAAGIGNQVLDYRVELPKSSHDRWHHR